LCGLISSIVILIIVVDKYYTPQETTQGVLKFVEC